MLKITSFSGSLGSSYISTFRSAQLRRDELIEALLTWRSELTHIGSTGCFVDTAHTAAIRHTPFGSASLVLCLLGCIIDSHSGWVLSQVFAVMAQAVLGNLDGVEVALRAPLSRQRHTCLQRAKKNGKIILNNYRILLVFKSVWSYRPF